MMDVIKKTLLAGVGAAIITKDKVEAALNEFVKDGKVSATEARQMAEKIAADGRREFDAMSKELTELFRDRASKEAQQAADRIAALEARVAALEQRASGAAGAEATDSATATGTGTVLDASGRDASDPRA